MGSIWDFFKSSLFFVILINLGCTESLQRQNPSDEGNDVLASGRWDGPNQVEGLFLVDTQTGQDIRQLQDNDSFELNPNLTIRAQVSEDVMVTKALLNDVEVNREARSSFSLNGLNSDGSYKSYSFSPGTYSVAFIPAKKERGKWVDGSPFTLSITFVEATPQPEEPTPPENPEPSVLNQVQSLILVNTDTGADIRVLSMQDQMDLNQINHGLSIRAESDSDVTISSIGGTEVNRDARDSKTLNGINSDGSYVPYSFSGGTHQITFVPSTKIDGVWTRGEPYQIQLQVIAMTTPDDPAPPEEPQPPQEPTPPLDADVVLTGNYGETQYRPRDLSGSLVFDATQASWTIDNCGWEGNQNIVGERNSYPVLLEAVISGTWYGGVWDSNIPQSVPWEDVYSCPNIDGNAGNSAALLARGELEVVGVRMNGAWDSVRFDQDGILRDSWISNGRDDAIEADDGNSVHLQNTLIDHTFVGLSSTPTGPKNSRLIIEDSLIRLGNYDYKGTIMPGAFIKCNTDTSPIEIHNSVFAFDRDSRINNENMKRAWPKVENCSNNLLLWLADGPLPSDFPLPPSCFQIKTGAEARDIWNMRRQSFINSF